MTKKRGGIPETHYEWYDDIEEEIQGYIWMFAIVFILAALMTMCS